MKGKCLKTVVSFVLVMALGVLSVKAVYAEENSTDENYTWEYQEETQTLVVAGTGALPDWNYEGLVPEEGDDEPGIYDWGTHYTPWYTCRDTAKTIIIEEGITEIGRYNFDDFTVLETIELPDSIESIREDTFPSGETAANITLKGKSGTVAELCAYAYGYTFVPTNECLRGDVDGDGEYTTSDALSILQMVVGLTEEYPYTADADENGTVDAADALIVLKKVVGLI